MRIVFSVKTLSIPGGGAERVLVEIASGLARRGHDIIVITSDPKEKKPYYNLCPSVRQINLDVGKVGGRTKFLDALMRIFAMRRVVRTIKPDVAIGFMLSSYFTLGVALKGTGIPVVASEHTCYEHYQSRTLAKTLLQLTPFVTEKMTVVADQVGLGYPRWMHKHLTTIFNPLNLQPSNRADVLGQRRRKKILLSVGSLESLKNQKCLISAFASIAGSVPEWNLRIVGEGDMRNELDLLIKSLNLTEKVQLPGAIKSIENEYANAQLFVLPSLYESFGLATAEALLHGLPSIGFSDCPGTNQLIRHNENGLLVSGENRIQSLAEALRNLMLNPSERVRLSGAATDWLVKAHNPDAILDQWEMFLNHIIGKSNFQTRPE